MRERHRPKLVVLLAGVSPWVLGVVTAGVWVWATALFELGAFGTLKRRCIFRWLPSPPLAWAISCPPGNSGCWRAWRRRTVFLNFGLLTALLIEALRQIRLGQFDHKRKGG